MDQDAYTVYFFSDQFTDEDLQTSVAYKHIPLNDIEDRIEEIGESLQGYQTDSQDARCTLL